jgi:hypothetical protein
MAILHSHIPNGRVLRIEPRYSPHNDLSILDERVKKPHGLGASSWYIDEYQVLGYWGLGPLFASIGMGGVGFSLMTLGILLFATLFLGGWGDDLMPSLQIAGVLMLFGLPALLYWWNRPFRRFLVFDPGRGLVHVPRFWGGMDRVRFRDLDFVILDGTNFTGSHVRSTMYMVRPGKPLESGMGEIRKILPFFLRHRFNLLLLQEIPTVDDARMYWQFLVEFMQGQIGSSDPMYLTRQMKELPTLALPWVADVHDPKARHFDPDTLGDEITWWKDEDGRWWRAAERPEPEGRRQQAEAELAPVRRQIAARRAELKEQRTWDRHFIRGDLLEDYLADMVSHIPRRRFRKLRRLWEQHVPPKDRVGGLGIEPGDFDAQMPAFNDALSDHPAVAEGRWWRSYDVEAEQIHYHIALTPFRGVSEESEEMSRARRAVEALLPAHIRSDVEVRIGAAPERSLFYRRALSKSERKVSSA